MLWQRNKLVSKPSQKLMLFTWKTFMSLHCSYILAVLIMIRKKYSNLQWRESCCLCSTGSATTTTTKATNVLFSLFFLRSLQKRLHQLRISFFVFVLYNHYPLLLVRRLTSSPTTRLALSPAASENILVLLWILLFFVHFKTEAKVSFSWNDYNPFCSIFLWMNVFWKEADDCFPFLSLGAI